MRAPNYILEEDLSLVTAYINFGGDGAVGVDDSTKKGKLWGKIIPYLNEKTKNPYKQTRNFVSLIGKVFQMKGTSWSPEDLGYDYTKYTDEDEEDVPDATIPTVEIDRENEEREEEQEEQEEQELDEEGEVEVDDGVRVFIYPPYKPTPNVEIEKDHPKKNTKGIKHIKALKKAKYTGENLSS
ncbi:hypothetical protein MKX03_022851 [Papaver bracteatum]|nr:hypothetical protein MKX03_022851 [Papaver bracteatum]